MKTILMLCALLVFAIPQMATADHIGIYSDCSGASCTLPPAGFSSTSVVIHKFTTGTIGSRFKLVFPAGSTFFDFSTTYVAQGDETGILVLYGTCLTGPICLGNLLGVFTAGTICVMPANGFATVTTYSCAQVELPATASGGTIGSPCFGALCAPLAVESSSWGSVKALYR